jgi:hypothetical protein
MSYVATKSSMCQVFALAAETSHATIAPSYSKVMDLDVQIEEAKASFPPALQYKPLELCITDNPEMLIYRFNLELLYLKSKTVLHRRFMVANAAQPATQPYSRICCIDSAMKTLSHHREIHRASSAGGLLESVSWYRCSIGTHDFLLASMIICLELARQLRDKQTGNTLSTHEITGTTRQDLIAALEASKRVWEEEVSAEEGEEKDCGLSSFVTTFDENTTTTLGDVRKACRAMAVMLEKVKKDQVQSDDTTIPPSSFQQQQDMDWLLQPASVMATTSTTTTTALPDMFPPTYSTNWQTANQWPIQNEFSSLDNMLDVPSSDINWVSFSICFGTLS